MVDVSVIPAYWDRSTNFGDALTPYLLKKITGKEVVHCDNMNNCTRMLVTGSILSIDNIENSIVWGCGYAWYADIVRKPKEIWGVRGLLSKEKLESNGIECPESFSDPAVLLPKFFNPVVEKKYKYGIMPHVVDYELVTNLYSIDYDVNIINLKRPIERVVEEMLQCERIISSSLHGLIVAHTYGILAQWVKFSNSVIGDDFKFHDYLSTYGIKPEQHYAIRIKERMKWEEIPFLTQPTTEDIIKFGEIFYSNCKLL